MKLIFKLAFLSMLAAGFSFADSLCTNATLDTYLIAGFTCHLDGVDFGNFTYTGSMTDPSNGNGIAASGVNVVVDPSARLSTLAFQAVWEICCSDTFPGGGPPPGGPNGPAFEDLNISFSAQSLSPAPIVSLENDAATSNFAGGTVTQSATCNAPCAPNTNYQNNTLLLSTPTNSPFIIQNNYQFTANGPNDIAHMSIVTDQVFEGRSFLPTPEPGSLLLGFGGLMALAACRRFRKQ